ncbi:MAG: hypothetical protein FJZ01_09140 [Candidatus Sericytochromatia bacterium]|nr:hypothetical protein [Candidatus Tanganyikabacteria bacterium]
MSSRNKPGSIGLALPPGVVEMDPDAVLRQLEAESAAKARDGAADAPPDRDWTLPKTDKLSGKPNIAIQTGPGALTRMADEAEAALMADSTCAIYQRGGVLVTVRRDAAEALRDGLTRHPDEPAIVPIAMATLREWMDRAAAWKKLNTSRSKFGWESADVPRTAIETLYARTAWRFPLLELISETPFLRPDGTVVDTPGWDSRTGILYEPPAGVTFPPVASDRDAAIEALRLLLDPLTDFPFTAEHHRAAAVAAIVSPLVRPTFAGPCPLFLVTANSSRIGKGLLMSVVSLIARGRPATVMAPPGPNPDETRKLITTIALNGDRMVLLDNVAGALGNAALDAALTAERWKDRVLNFNRMYDGPLRAIWYATGNNVQLRGDAIGRVVPIEMFTDLENPEERTGFRHDDLDDWVRRNRPALVSAALTIVRAYLAAGAPRMHGRELGGFTGWTRIVRDALLWLGMPDATAGRAELKATADPALRAMLSVLIAWRDLYDSRAVTLAEVARDTKNCGAGRERDLADALAELSPARKGGDEWDARSAGNTFKHFAGRRFGDLRLVRAPKSKHGTLWVVESLAISQESANDADEWKLI